MKYVTDVPKDMPIRTRAALLPDDFDSLESLEQYVINDTLHLLYWDGHWKADSEEMPNYSVWIRVIGPEDEFGFKVHPGDELDLIFEHQDHGDLTWWEYIRPVEVPGDELTGELDGRQHMLFGQVESLRQSGTTPQFVLDADASELLYKVEWRLL